MNIHDRLSHWMGFDRLQRNGDRPMPYSATMIGVKPVTADDVRAIQFGAAMIDPKRGDLLPSKRALDITS